MYDEAPLVVKFWGDWACFTRPELKVERVSYPVITPSAARGALEAIFWKPGFRWQIRRIGVLQPIRYFSLLRNEVKNKVAVSSVKNWGPCQGYYADQDRAQRHTLALRNVAYLVWADVILKPHANGIDPAKYRDQFRRRVAKGQCHHQPYLGCREFSAFFGCPDEYDVPISVTEDLGLMLFDLIYEVDGSGRGKPQFFEAQLKDGILSIPQGLYEDRG